MMAVEKKEPAVVASRKNVKPAARKPLSVESVRLQAYYNYLGRMRNNLSGNEKSDWIEAERMLLSSKIDAAENPSAAPSPKKAPRSARKEKRPDIIYEKILPIKSIKKVSTNATVVSPVGNLDLYAIQGLEEVFNLTMDEYSDCNILVDLHEVGYMGSSCLRLIVTVHYALKTKGLKLVLFEPNLVIRKLLELTEMNKHITVRESLDQALESVS